MRSDERLYLTVDRERVVKEGDPEAAFLLVNEGGEVPTEYNRIFREYRDANKAEAEPAVAETAPEPEAKAVEKPAENKARARADAK